MSDIFDCSGDATRKGDVRVAFVRVRHRNASIAADQGTDASGVCADSFDRILKRFVDEGDRVIELRQSPIDPVHDSAVRLFLGDTGPNDLNAAPHDSDCNHDRAQRSYRPQ